jgi:hypothetical protein
MVMYFINSGRNNFCSSFTIKICKNFKKKEIVKNVDISTNLKKPTLMEIFGSEKRAYAGKRGFVVPLGTIQQLLEDIE